MDSQKKTFKINFRLRLHSYNNLCPIKNLLLFWYIFSAFLNFTKPAQEVFFGQVIAEDGDVLTAIKEVMERLLIPILQKNTGTTSLPSDRVT